jgi:hypothetical protein
MRRISSPIPFIVPVVAASIIVASGCTPRMAYPPVAGPSSGGIGTADDAPGPQVMATALKAVAKRNGDTSFAFSLPAGLRESSWTAVGRSAGAETRWASEGDSDFYAVESVRVDGGTATVEVAAPKAGHFQLFTVRLVGGGFDSYRVTSVQPWTVRYDPPAVNSPVGSKIPASMASTSADATGF